MTIFNYGQVELEYLSKCDSHLAKAIEKYGFIERAKEPNLFLALVSAIVGQQISGKAAETIWNRLLNLTKEITAENLISQNDEDMRGCGISYRKISYIKGVALAYLDGQLDQSQICKMEDQEIIEKLTALKGVGVWTAEMLLIFSLERKNILSFGDLGIKRGIAKVYSDQNVSLEKFRKLKERYSPYSTVASFYLWEVASDKEF